MASIDLIRKEMACAHCTFYISECVCPKSTARVVTSYQVTKIGRKQITRVWGHISLEDHRRLKERLGVGGNYYSECVTFRGNVAKKCLKLLREEGYVMYDLAVKDGV